MLDKMTIEARAKINLSIDVTGLRPDGYHDVRMLMQTVCLHDEVTIERADGAITVESDSPDVAPGVGNTACKAAIAFFGRIAAVDRKGSGVRIGIKKNIPVSAGLAGGSADAAAVLHGLNVLFDAGLAAEELAEIGLKVGADVPYCIYGGTMLAEGIGELLEPLPPFSGVDILIIKPEFAVSTKWVYENLDLNKITDRPDFSILTEAVAGRRTDTDKADKADKADNAYKADIIARNMKNVLETVTASKYPEISILKKILLEYGASGSMMSGSGPAVFGIFPDGKSARNAKQALDAVRNDRRIAAMNCWVHLTQTC